MSNATYYTGNYGERETDVRERIEVRKTGITLVDWDTDPPTEYYTIDSVLAALARFGILVESRAGTELRYFGTRRTGGDEQ